jgi:ankyrin repeat protein
VQPNAMDVNGWTPLHIAAVNGHKEVVRLLLSKEGMDPELVDDSGQTALEWAAKLGHVDIVHILEDHIGSKMDVASE